MTTSSSDIAIVGMAGRFPGSSDIFQFWKNICNGADSISRFTDEEEFNNSSCSDLNDSQYVKAKGVLNDASNFAASFFGYSPNEATIMDPQHRLLLETAYHALENAGIIPAEFNGHIGTFVSASFNTYLLHCLSEKPELRDHKNQYQLALANSNDFLATRIAYKLNLTGPAQTVQTACSSSLVAVHHACQSLLSYESDAVIAGGASVTYPFISGYLYKHGGIGSPDGYCRPFDANAAGTVPGNGVGLVVLKRLEDAIINEDHVYAVIKSSALNNDGNKKMSFTAPSVHGQEYCIRTAHALAGIESSSVSYIEAHGTGTLLGDPIEVEALTRAFNLEQKQFCAIGSIKANIGHLDAAAGIAGLLKTALMLYHQKLVPQINYSSPNPHIPFYNSPFYINTSLKPWVDTCGPRRAGVSSFGIGGTNAHVILEEPPKKYDGTKTEKDWVLLPISGENADILNAVRIALVDFLSTQEQYSLNDVSYTLKHHRYSYNERSFIFVRKCSDKVHCVFPESEEMPSLLNTITTTERNLLQKWLNKQDVDWKTSSSKGSIVPLPFYPFHRQDFIINSSARSSVTYNQTITEIASPPFRQMTPTNLLEILSQIVSDFVGDPNFNPDDNFEDLGIDSLGIIDLGFEIEKKIGNKISMQTFYSHPTVRLLTKHIEETSKAVSRTADNTNRLSVEITNGTPGYPNLFCIHPAGGTVGIFKEISAHIEWKYKLIGIRSRGWNEGESPDDNILSMARDYLNTIKSIQINGPYFICGSSIGGTIAFEIARLLMSGEDEVAFLGLIDSPSTLHEKGTIIPSTDQEISDYIIRLCPDMLNELNQAPQRDNRAFDAFYQNWKLHAASLLTYTPTPLGIKIIYFMAGQPDNMLPNNMADDWLKLAQKGLETHTIKGNHISVHLGEGAIEIAKIINNKLQEFHNSDIARVESSFMGSTHDKSSLDTAMLGAA